MPITLSQVHSLPSLQRTYKWDLSFPNPPSMLTSVLGADFSGKFNIRAISTSVPVARFDKVSVAPRGIDLDEPGLVHLNGDITFQLVDTVDLFTRRALYTLRQICMNDETKEQQDMNAIAARQAGGAAFTNNQGQSLTMKMDRLDVHNRVNWTYIVYKAFITGYTDPDFGGDSSAVTPSMTISYNYFIDGTPEEVAARVGLTSLTRVGG